MLDMLSRSGRRERCRATRAQMSDYLDGELEDPRAVERHLA